MNRLLSISAALAMAVSASAFANSHKEAPMLTNVAASAPMTAQQKALEYLFFDLSACVSVDSVPPPPPPPPTR